MTAKLKKLPIGIQDFEILINQDYIYVDKTEHLYNLIETGRVYFLSRPRRFGKSLLLSTFKAIFQSKKELFKDLWIGKSDYQFEAGPVIHLDMSKLKNESTPLLEMSIVRQLNIIAKEYNCSIDNINDASGAFDALINQLSEQGPVTILIDEYDKPIIDQIDNIEQAKKNRDVLRQFYAIIKSQDANIRFVFLTGVTKFSKVSVFSGLISPEDLTMAYQTANLLGYTQQ